MFQKEISSDGNVNTVDFMYPVLPFFLYTNPELLRYNLQPLFQNQEAGIYPNGYSMHDLGTHYPNATGHVEGNDEYMPVRRVEHDPYELCILQVRHAHTILE